MPADLIVTPGGPDTNSYADLAEADDYNSSRPFADSWASLTPEVKTSALLYAALLLDSTFLWTGNAATPEQQLCWPRVGMVTRNGFPIDPTTIPRELKMSQSEYARQLSVTDLTATNDALVQGISMVRAGSVMTSFSKTYTQSEMVALMNTNYAYLSKNVPDAARIILPPSWYKEMPILIGAGGKGGGGYNPFYFSVDR